MNSAAAGSTVMTGFPTRAPIELVDRPCQQQRLIDGLWGRQAVGIVGGEPKCGKSFLALDIAVAVAAGVPSLPDLAGLAGDLKAAWSAPGVSMRARQRLVRTLIAGIVADVDEEAREVLLTIHWVGGLHSRLRVRKPRTGEYGCRTPEKALGVIRSMAGRWSDEHNAASLNRRGMRTGQQKSWTGKRVGSIRRVNGIDGYLPADKRGDWYP